MVMGLEIMDNRQRTKQRFYLYTRTKYITFLQLLVAAPTVHTTQATQANQNSVNNARFSNRPAQNFLTQAEPAVQSTQI